MIDQQRRPVDVGSFRQLLRFMLSSNPRNASGGFGENLVEQFRVRGKLTPMPMSRTAEQFTGVDWTTNVTPYVGVIRWRADVTEQMVIQNGTRLFRIRSCPQVERADRYMEILCEEVKS